jgi:hypothetical protein
VAQPATGAGRERRARLSEARRRVADELASARAVERASPENPMKRAAAIAVLTLLAAFSLPAAAGAPSGSAGPAPVQAHAKNCVPSRDAAPDARSPSKAPPIRVCVSDSNTQLNLPWFLTDVLTAVDTHQSGGDLLRKMRNDF